MDRSATQNRLAPVFFLGCAGAIYATALAVARLLPTLDGAGAVAVGVTIDLVVLVPLLFYWLIVRRRGWPVATVVPVLVLSFVAARWILPVEHRQTLGLLELLAVPAEIGLLAWIARRATRAIRIGRRDGAADPVERLRSAALEFARHDRVADLLASEIAVFYYAFGSWRVGPHAPAGLAAFTHHRRSSHGAIVLAFLMAIFSIRAGLRFSLSVPRERIGAVLGDKPDFGKESANLTFLATPTTWIVLSQPMLACGPYGFRRRVRAVGVATDDPDGLRRALGTSSA